MTEYKYNYKRRSLSIPLFDEDGIVLYDCMFIYNNLDDIDILIFGKSPEVFDEYERRIRKEYLWVDNDEYNAGRPAILQRFLNRPGIYHTDIFYDRYEKQVMENLKRSLLHMTGQSVQKDTSEE